LLKAVWKHAECKWVRQYIERWLKAPMQLEDGTLVERTKGTPQGGVVFSPVLSNLFLHYAFDLWMSWAFPGVLWCRYADDGLVHCKTERQAKAILAALAARFDERGLQLHPEKTRIVYCKDGKRRARYSNTKFEFLGYEFRPRKVKNRKRNTLFVAFTPAVSATAAKSMRQTTRRWNFRNRTDLGLEDISRLFNLTRTSRAKPVVGSFNCNAEPPGKSARQSCRRYVSRCNVAGTSRLRCSINGSAR
jgi:RNA-directed DNA polymerase